VSEPPDKTRRRRPTLAGALRAARKAGQKVKSATVEADGKVTLTFGDEPPTESNEWDEALRRDKH
jgi:hypothetical protein